MKNFNLHHNLFVVAAAGGLLSACTNPAPTYEPALARAEQTACQVAERAAQSLPEQARGLYQQQGSTPDAASSSTRDYARAATCPDLLSGSYAIRVELDVYAQEDQSAVSAQYDPVRGRATLLLRADIDPVRTAEAQLHLCGLELPTRYAYATSTATQLIVPDETWDRESMPVWNSRIHANKTQLQLDAFPVLLGIDLTDPGAAWPNYEQTPKIECGAGESGIGCFPDHDGDGEPGFTLSARADSEVSDAPYPACHEWSYAAPSTQPEPWLSDNSAGAARSFVGLRTALQMFLDLDESCQQGTGSVIAEDIQTRTLDCELTNGQRCTPYEAAALDARAPSFHVLAKRETLPQAFHDSREFIDESLNRAPSDGGRVSVRRLAASETATCTSVRAVFDM